MVFKNGDVITGKVMALKDGNFEIKTAMVGDVKAPWAAVASIETEKPMYVEFEGRSVECREVAVSDDGVRLVGPGCERDFVAKSELRSIQPESARMEEERLKHAGPFHLWTGSFDAGMSAARSDASSTNINVGMKASRVTLEDRMTLNTTSLYSRTRSAAGDHIDSTAVRAGARYSRNVSQKMFAFGFANFETDELQALDLRRVLGTGLGYRAVATPRFRFDVFSGGSYLRESFETQPRREAGEMLLGQELSYKPGKAELAQTVSVFPNLTDTGEYRVSLDSSVRVSLNSWLSWQTTLSNIYISNPPVSSPGNSFLASTGIRVSLGKERTFTPSAKIAGL